MSQAVLITGIGGSIGIDVARLLRADPDVVIIGCDANPWGLRQTESLVDESVLVPRADRETQRFFETINGLIERHDVVASFINPDPELEAMAERPSGLAGGQTTPCSDTTAVCLDKAQTVARVGHSDLFPATIEIASEADVHSAFTQLGSPLWVRARVGPGGRGSLTVETPDEALSWMRYWDRRDRGYRWVIQEFLPGRNVNWTGVYVGGECVVDAAMVRLSYFLADSAASGVSGQVSACETVEPAEYRELCDRVVRGLEDKPHGLFSVDLRHDRDGRARVTEVNPRLAGRPYLYGQAGVNLAVATVRAFSGKPVADAVDPGGLRVGLRLMRQLDIEPVVADPNEVE